MAYKTPGVYIKEISVFPPSVAEVETAIPAFIGYTEKAERRGEDLTNVPTRIKSLLEYRELFGDAFEITQVDVKVDANNNYAVTSATPTKRFYMDDALRLFFDNGGGNCYIVSVDRFIDSSGAVVDVQNGDESVAGSKGLRVGLKALEKYDEPTIILFPDAQLLKTEAHLYTLQQKTLAQCGRLQDRVGLFDLKEGGRSLDKSIDAFRDKIGINNLKYGTAYTPWIHSAFPKAVDFSVFGSHIKDQANASVDLSSLTSDSSLNALVVDTQTAIADRSAINSAIDTRKGASATLKDWYKTLRDTATQAGTNDARKTALQDLLKKLRALHNDLAAWKGSLKGASLSKDLDAYAESHLAPALEALIALEKNTDVLVVSDLADASEVDTAYTALNGTGWLGKKPDDSAKTVSDIAASAIDYGDSADAAAILPGILADLDNIFQAASSGSMLSFIEEVSEAAGTHAGMAQKVLYEQHPIVSNIVTHIKKELARTPPSGAVAGVYAFVDRTRGVWKAPANVSLNTVLGPVEAIDDSEQENINVDTTGGKSINAIRAFSGKGTLVWGARTLAGNDNEWRYVPVRRFFNMVEESVKKSTAWAVFEPNSAPLWVKVKSMIENYLIQKWREGALAGATPEEAFFVKIGLGETMTAQDILEGRLIVEIGMAAVRPAEFIILKFSHKMQES